MRIVKVKVPWRFTPITDKLFMDLMPVRTDMHSARSFGKLLKELGLRKYVYIANDRLFHQSIIVSNGIKGKRKKGLRYELMIRD